MTFYWRLKDIPELRDVPKKDRREWWREAASRSHTTRGMFAVLGQYFVAIVGADVITALFGYRSGPIHLCGMFVGILLASIVNDYWLIQPRARQWLQQHINDQSFD